MAEEKCEYDMFRICGVDVPMEEIKGELTNVLYYIFTNLSSEHKIMTLDDFYKKIKRVIQFSKLYNEKYGRNLNYECDMPVVDLIVMPLRRFVGNIMINVSYFNRLNFFLCDMVYESGLNKAIKEDDAVTQIKYVNVFGYIKRMVQEEKYKIEKQKMKQPVFSLELFYIQYLLENRHFSNIYHKHRDCTFMKKISADIQYDFVVKTW
jgi:hypothetical protein